MRCRPALLAPMLFVILLIASACAGGEEQPIDCSNAISWAEVSEHLEEYATVRGPVVDAYPGFEGGVLGGSNAALLLGRSAGDENWYLTPSALRSQPAMGFVVWVRNFDEFPEAPEQRYAAETICVRGLIEGYGSEPKAGPWWTRTYMTIDSPSDIVIVD